MNNLNKFSLSTRAILAGEQKSRSHNPVVPDMALSTSFKAPYDASFSIEGQQDQELPFFYTRWSNPTIRRLETKIANLESAGDALAFGSGMAAVTALLLYELKAGDRLVISDVCYAAVSEAVNDLYPGLDITIDRVNLANPDAVREALSRETDLVYIETPSNPLLRLTDIAAVVKEAQKVNAKVAVDSTFATPAATRPLELGADYVVHSLTKFLNGHGDAVGGAIAGSEEAIQEMRRKILIKTGGVMSPFNAWLIMRGMATFPMRMQTHERNAMAVAELLEDHPKVTQTIYPGLPSHPQYELAYRQMNNFSGMITFQVQEGKQAASLMAKQLEVTHYAVSLGHHHSLIYYLPTDDMLDTTFALSDKQEASYRAYAGDGIFRLSVGLEDANDNCRDLQGILDQL